MGRLLNPDLLLLFALLLQTTAALTFLACDPIFDGAFGEYTNLCGSGLFHVLGIKKYAVTQTMAYFDDSNITGVPLFPSFTPSVSSLHGHQMSFSERASNIIFNYFNQYAYYHVMD